MNKPNDDEKEYWEEVMIQRKWDRENLRKDKIDFWLEIIGQSDTT